jgi:hypothetical protein
MALKLGRQGNHFPRPVLTAHQGMLLGVFNICIGPVESTRLANAHESMIFVMSSGKIRQPSPTLIPTTLQSLLLLVIVDKFF